MIFFFIIVQHPCRQPNRTIPLLDSGSHMKQRIQVLSENYVWLFFCALIHPLTYTLINTYTHTAHAQNNNCQSMPIYLYNCSKSSHHCSICTHSTLCNCIYISHYFSNTIVVVINLSSPIELCMNRHVHLLALSCNARGHSKMNHHVSPRSTWVTNHYLCGPAYISLVFFVVVVFFYIYCFLKINIVVFLENSLTNRLCVFFGVLDFMSLSIPLLLFFFLEWSIHIIMRSSTTFLLKSRLKPSNDLSGITGLSAWPSWSSAGLLVSQAARLAKYSKPL